MSQLRAELCSECGLPLKYGGYYRVGEGAISHMNCRAAAKGQLREAHDLLRRIRQSSEDNTLYVPDVAHAVEAEITELLGDQT